MKKKFPFSAKLLTGRFVLETQVKGYVSGYFLRDAKEWREIYITIQDFDDPRLSIAAKNFVNLRLSMECALKSIAISLSKRHETAENAYREMRKCSHDLVKLEQLCSSRADGRYRIVTPKFRQSLRRINDLGIGLRYDLDFKTAYKAQTVSELYGDGPVSGVVLDDEFRRSTLGEVTNLCERARRIRERRFEKHKGHTLSEGSRIEAYIRRLI